MTVGSQTAETVQIKLYDSEQIASWARSVWQQQLTAGS